MAAGFTAPLPFVFGAGAGEGGTPPATPSPDSLMNPAQVFQGAYDADANTLRVLFQGTASVVNHKLDSDQCLQRVYDPPSRKIRTVTP